MHRVIGQQIFLQLMEVAVKLPPFKAPKVAPVEYEPSQLLPLPELLDEEVLHSPLTEQIPLPCPAQLAPPRLALPCPALLRCA